MKDAAIAKLYITMTLAGTHVPDRWLPLLVVPAYPLMRVTERGISLDIILDKLL